MLRILSTQDEDQLIQVTLEETAWTGVWGLYCNDFDSIYGVIIWSLKLQDYNCAHEHKYSDNHTHCSSANHIISKIEKKKKAIEVNKMLTELGSKMWKLHKWSQQAKKLKIQLCINLGTYR